MMRRMLVALALFASCGLALAATPVNVKVLYTPGAASYISGLGGGSNIGDFVGAQIGAVNTALTASGLDVQINPSLSQTVRGPSDTASPQEQFYWARNDFEALNARAGWDAGIVILITDPGASGSFNIATSPGTITQVQDAVAVVPVRATVGGALTLEQTLIRIMAGPNGSKVLRERRYGYSGISGNLTCAHTREGPPADTNTIVPFLSPVYTVSWLPGNAGEDSTGPTAAIACTAFRLTMVSQAQCNGNSCATNNVTGTESPSALFCEVWNNSSPPARTLNPGIIKTTNSGGAAVNCTDDLLSVYSGGGSYQGLPLNDSTHNTVAAMNARKSLLSTWNDTARSVIKWAQANTWCGAYCPYFIKGSGP